jgi:hypothetical protein
LGKRFPARQAIENHSEQAGFALEKANGLCLKLGRLKKPLSSAEIKTPFELLS